jgi:2-methylcitrate dehydratase PrpD
MRVMTRVTPEADPSMGIAAAHDHPLRRRSHDRGSSERGAGHPANPLTRDEVEEKFRRLAGVVLPPERVSRIETALRELADLPNMADLAALTAN